MANYANLKSAIQYVIKANGNNEITGNRLQTELISMINTLGYGYQFMGIATPTTVPGTPDAKVFYIAFTPGTYPNFDGMVVTGLCVLKYATSWTKDDIPISGGGGGSYTLPVATPETLGGVKIGSGLQIDNSGVLSVPGGGGGSVGFTTEPNDLTLATTGGNNVLKFADRLRETYLVSGYNYVIMRESGSFDGQLVGSKTIYEIRYDFDLNGAAITLDANVILKFVGGSISNGTITGNGTVIDAPNAKVFNNVSFAGTFIGGLNACWIGAVPNNSTFDNSAIIQSWFDGYSDVFKLLYFPTGTYYFLTESTMSVDKRDLVLDGNNSLFNINIATNDAYFIKIQTTSTSAGENFRIQNVRIKNVKQTSGQNISRTRAILFDGTQRFSITNVQIWNFDVAVELINVWYGGFYGQTVFRANRIGVLARTANKGGEPYYEVNTIELHNVDFNGVSRSVVEAIYPQESGESDADYLKRTASCGIDIYCLVQAFGVRGCVFETFDYGIRTNWYKRSSAGLMQGGPLAITDCYFEDNRQDDINVGSNNQNAYGTGSNYQRFVHIVNVSNCRFFGKKHITFMAVIGFLSSNQPVTLLVSHTDYASSNIDYQGPVTIEGTVSKNSTVHRIAGRSYEIYNQSGQYQVPQTDYQRVQITRYFGETTSLLSGYKKTGSTSGSYNVKFNARNFETLPKTKFVFDIHPLEYFTDLDNSFNRLFVPSGNGYVPVRCEESYNFRALNTNGGIPLAEFIRRWKAGTNYEGTVMNLFPYKVTANPTAGTVYNESGTLVGFGINALGTTVTPSIANTYLIFVDALIWARISSARIKQYADHLQCGRTYAELRGTNMEGDFSGSKYLACYGTNADMASVQKRLNAVYYDTTNSKLMIYNGFEWVEMTSPYQRYYYKEYGLKLSERATMADLPGQTFINYATGIKYTFMFRANNNYKWVPSIGLVDDLAHPNGYSSDSTLDYANELSTGEMVMYNGALYKWDGTQLVAM